MNEQSRKHKKLVAAIILLSVPLILLDLLIPLYDKATVPTFFKVLALLLIGFLIMLVPSYFVWRGNYKRRKGIAPQQDRANQDRKG